jgi:hypothetical protein
MRLAKFKQAPLENKRYAIDYSQWLDSNETLVGTQLNVRGVTTPPLVASTATIAEAGTTVVFFVSGGLDGEEYQIDILATSSSGQIKEDSVLYIIEDPDDDL